MTWRLLAMQYCMVMPFVTAPEAIWFNQRAPRVTSDTRALAPANSLFSQSCSYVINPQLDALASKSFQKVCFTRIINGAGRRALYIYREIDRERETDRQTETETQRHRERERDRERQRETQRETETETQTQRERERERERENFYST